LTYELDGRFDQAAAHYEDAIRLDPFNARLHHHAARAYASGQQFADAVLQYQTILDLAPEDLEAVMGLVRIWIVQKQFDRAEAFLARQLERLDHPPELYVALGILYREAKQNAEAMRAFERAVALKGDYAQAHFYLAAQLDQLGRREAARQRLRRTIELDHDHADAMNYLGYLDAEEGVNLNEAEALIQRALILDPTNGAYVDSLGWVYFKLGRLDEAIATLERAVDLLETDPVIFDHLGEAYFHHKDLDRARKAWERAFELDPTQTAIQEKLERLTPEAITVNEP
jgi:tetratricopeptide (TPR) repeat protein